MSFGGGKYDKEAQELLERLGADGLVLIVTGGPRGEGMEIQVSDTRLLRALPMVLKGAAVAIELDLEKLGRLDS